MAGAIVLPRQPSHLEALGQLLGALGNIPGQMQNANLANQQAQVQGQQMQNMKAYQDLIGQALATPKTISTANIPSAPAASSNEFGGVVQPATDTGLMPTQTPPTQGATPATPTFSTAANPKAKELQSQLDEMGRFFGAPRQGLTYEEQVGKLQAQGEVEKARDQGKSTAALELQKQKDETAVKVKNIWAESEKNKQTIDENYKKQIIPIKQQEATTAAGRLGVAQQNANSFSQNVSSLTNQRLAQIQQAKGMLEVAKEHIGLEKASRLTGALGDAEKQLTQVNKLMQQATDDPNNPNIPKQIESALGQYEAIHSVISKIDPEVGRQFDPPKVESPDNGNNLIWQTQQWMRSIFGSPKIELENTKTPPVKPTKPGQAAAAPNTPSAPGSAAPLSNFIQQRRQAITPKK